MTAEYQDEVDGLTLGQCVDHPKWPTAWHSQHGWNLWGICDIDDKPVVVEHRSPVEAARAALRTLLPPRPPEVVVTEEDCAFSRKLENMIGCIPGSDSWHCRRAELIAAYRTKHAGKP